MNQSRPATVILIDDDDSIRRALGRLLRSAGHFVRAYGSARAFLESELTPPEGPCCLVLDLQMPGLSGIELQRTMRERDMTIPIVFISGHGDIPTSVTAMKQGAVDFLPKPVQESDLLQAIGSALERDRRDRDSRASVAAARAGYETLTPREREVMSLVVRGLLNKQVAAELGTVEKTIKVHRARVMEKMQCSTLADLVRAAERLKRSA